MESVIAANFVERRTRRVVEGFMRKATEFDLLGWTTWRYKFDDEDRDWDWWTIYAKSQRSRSRKECYAAIVAGELQGLMASLGMLRRPRKSKDGHVVFAFDPEGAQQFLEQMKKKRILIL